MPDTIAMTRPQGVDMRAYPLRVWGWLRKLRCWRWPWELMRGVGRELRQLMSPQSAFTMGDLLNVACADVPHARLERIYEWYFARTMTAIRVLFGAAGATFAAIYGLVVKDSGNVDLSRGLAVTGVLLAVAGVVQLRQLAQLHRELAAALRLLTQVMELPGVRIRKAPAAQSTPTTTLGNVGRGIGVAALLAGISVLILQAAEIKTEVWEMTRSPGRALTVVAVLVSFALLVHVVAEIWPHEPPAEIAHPPETLDEEVGHIRLDEYVLNPKVTAIVDTAIRPRDA